MLKLAYSNSEFIRYINVYTYKYIIIHVTKYFVLDCELISIVADNYTLP